MTNLEFTPLVFGISAVAGCLGARTGLSIAVPERGEARKTADYLNGMDELDYAIRFRMMQDASKETVTFRHTSKDRALPVRQFASQCAAARPGTRHALCRLRG